VLIGYVFAVAINGSRAVGAKGEWRHSEMSYYCELRLGKIFTATIKRRGGDNIYPMARAKKLLARLPREFMMIEERHPPLDATIWVQLLDPPLTAVFPDFVDSQIST
jgi:hypothetical protein